MWTFIILFCIGLALLVWAAWVNQRLRVRPRSYRHLFEADEAYRRQLVEVPPSVYGSEVDPQQDEGSSLKPEDMAWAEWVTTRAEVYKEDPGFKSRKAAAEAYIRRMGGK